METKISSARDWFLEPSLLLAIPPKAGLPQRGENPNLGHRYKKMLSRSQSCVVTELFSALLCFCPPKCAFLCIRPFLVPLPARAIFYSVLSTARPFLLLLLLLLSHPPQNPDAKVYPQPQQETRDTTRQGLENHNSDDKSKKTHEFALQSLKSTNGSVITQGKGGVHARRIGETTVPDGKQDFLIGGGHGGVVNRRKIITLTAKRCGNGCCSKICACAILVVSMPNFLSF